MTIKIIRGDALSGLAGVADESVHCCVTSPPYFGLRSYLPDDHPDKGKEIGLEATPEEFIANLVAVFREVRRVLRKDGVLFLNIGDSYAVNGGAHGGRDDNQRGVGAARTHASGGGDQKPRRAPNGLKAKDLIGIPWQLAFALRADGWYLRGDYIWHKPSCMPESVTDRCTKSHEYVFHLTKSASYFWDQQAIAEKAEQAGRIRADQIGGNKYVEGVKHSDGGIFTGATTRNKRSVWSINPQPFKDSHFATMPPELAETCIKAGSSQKGCCSKCGAPWGRATEAGYQSDHRPQMKRARELFAKNNLTDAHLDAIRAVGITDAGKAQVTTDGFGKNDPEKQRLADEAKIALKGYYREFLISRPVTTGWSPSCSCEDASVVPCTVLDPFSGAGTTALVADRLQRNAIGIELHPDYPDMAEKRISGDRGGLLDLMEAVK